MKRWFEWIKKKKTAYTIAAILVVFFTTYSLILPALTIEKSTASEQAGIVLDQEAANEAEENAVTVEKTTTESEPEADVEADAMAETSDDQGVATERHDEESSMAVAEGVTESTMPAQDFEQELKEEKITVYVKAEEGALPEGSEMKVEAVDDKDVIAKIAEEAEDKADEGTTIGEVQAVDISFWKDDVEIEPEDNVYVTIASALIEDTDEQMIVHVNDEDSDKVADNKKGKAEVVEPMTDTELEEKDITPAKDEIVFAADQFSVYGIVATETISVDYLSKDGKTYAITVDIPENANIPAGADLVVEELVKGTAKYDEYLEKTANTLRLEQNEIEYIKLLDISIVKDGKEIEPAVPVNVSIKLLDKAETSKTQVIHFADNPVLMDVNAEGKTVSFETPGFSIYAVVDEASTEYRRVKIEFYNYDGTHIADMIVKNNDTEDDVKTVLYDPGTGTLPEKTVFKGWWQGDSANYTVADTDVGQAKTIDDIRSWVLNEYDFPAYVGSDNMPVVKFYAMVYKYFNVTYYGDDEDISLGTHTEYLLTTDTETAYSVSMAYTPDANQNFKGWKPTDDTKANITEATRTADDIYPNGTNITITGDVVFNVEAPHGNWLVYNANGKGATYNAPQFFLTNETTSPAVNATPENMKRNGYEFGGWYTATTGEADDTGYTPVDETKPFTFGSTLEENTTIYAKWTPVETAPYTVVFWTQNTDRTAYDVAGSYVGRGRVGNPIFTSSNFKDNTDEDYAIGFGSGGHYTGFCLNHSNGAPLDKDGQVAETVTITPEGDAVLNLYYDRIEYEFRFYYYRERAGRNPYSAAQYSASYTGDGVYGVAQWYGWGNTRPTQTYGPDHTAAVEGYTAHYFTLKAYYGQDISSLWPTYAQLGSYGQYDAVSYVMMNGTGLKKEVNAAGTGTGHGSDTIKGLITIMDEMILGKTNDADGNFVVIRYSTRNDWDYHIFYEQIEGEDYSGKTTYRYNGKAYYEDHVVDSRSTNTNVSEQNHPQYTGYEYVGESNRTGQSGGTNGNNARWTTGNGSNTTYHVRYYYDRKLYNITYMDGVYVDGNNNIIQTRATELLENNNENIIQGAAIPNQYKNYVPDLPAGEVGYVFDGWYLDEACTVPYTWTTMPVGGIQVHAKWRQVEYRVFLHPNAGTQESDPELTWGTEDQKMSFRRPYGGKISLPAGRRPGYEFVGWFKDEALTQVFTDATELNEQTVTADYDKTVNMTDPIDQWGVVGSGAYNSDASRDWITKKLDLYAKWRKILVGADGINVVYTGKDPDVEAEGTVIPTDELKYLDTAPAIAKQALTAPEGYVFDYWVVQRWDGNAFVDTDIIAYPGDSFEVLLDNARQVQNPDHTEDNPSYTYTIQVRPKYALAEHETPTFIPWYANNETANTAGEDFVVFEDNVEINEMQLIKPADTFTYAGYRFVGWARVPIEIVDADAKKTSLDTTLDGRTVDYSSYLFLEYREDGNFYSTANTIGHGVNSAGVKVNGIAPDESSPYHAMVAVWEKTPGLLVKKTDETGNKYIDKAAFVLMRNSDAIDPDVGGTRNESDNSWTMTSGEDGLHYSGIGNGTYILTEKAAPDGYIITNPTTMVYVHDSKMYSDEDLTTELPTNTDGDYIVTVKNEAGKALPNTGGPGTTTLKIFGTTLVLFAGAMLLMRKRKRVSAMAHEGKGGGSQI